MSRSLALILATFISTLTCFAQARGAAVRAEPIIDEAEGRAFVQDLLSQTPAQSMFYGVLKMRDTEGRRAPEVRLRYSTVVTESGWQAIYETQPARGIGSEKLIIIHKENQPNQYIYTPAQKQGEDPQPPLLLTGSQADVPFAGSDYWLSDLGMEFLHWPKQGIVKDAKLTMRKSRPCKVLESVNPNPTATGYARVRSWIDAENGSLIVAEAYDRDRKRFKIFSPRGVQKVEGRWQPKELEILNEKTDSRTQLELQFD